MDERPSGSGGPVQVPASNTLADAATPNTLSTPGPAPSAPASSPSWDPRRTADAAAGETPAAGVPSAPTPRRRGLLAGVVAILAGLVVLGLKLAMGVASLAVVGSALGSVFGGPYDRLPLDQRQQLEARFNAAVGDTLRGLSDADVAARVEALNAGGLPRLGDETLVEYERIWATGIQAADTASCAAVARTGTGVTIDTQVMDRVIGALDTPSIGRWFEINMEAIEAQAKGAPPARSVSSAAGDAMYSALFKKVSATDVATLKALSNGGTASDADACSAYRDLYAAGLQLSPADTATFALTDVSP